MRMSHAGNLQNPANSTTKTSLNQQLGFLVNPSGRWIVVASVVIYTVLVPLGSMFVTLSKDARGHLPYKPAFLELVVALLKFLVSAICLAVQLIFEKERRKEITLRGARFFVIPAVIYSLDNNLQYFILLYYSPATFQVLYNMRILTTALFFSWILEKKITKDQWVALVLLLLGIVNCEASETQGLSFLHKPVGFALVVAASTLSALGDVYIEYLLKRQMKQSVHFQNMQLYFFGIIANFIALLSMSSLQHSTLQPAVSPYNPSQMPSFFNYRVWTSGFGFFPALIVIVNSITGLCVAFMLKFANNLLKIFVNAAALILSLILSSIWFDFAPTLGFLTGAAVVLVSVYLFQSHQPSISSPTIRVFAVDAADLVDDVVIEDEEDAPPLASK